MANNQPWPEWRLAPCGTAAAARRHWRRGEPLDFACTQSSRRETADRQRSDVWRAGANEQPDYREIRNGIPWKPYVYRGRGYDTLTGETS